MLTPEQRVLRARHAGLVRSSRHDPRELAEKGRDGLLRRFEREVDPEGTLPPAERLRRAEAARRAHMTALAFKSSRSRTAQAGGGAT